MTEFLDAIPGTRELIIEHTPLRRMGLRDEIAYYVVNFCSPRGRFATGEILDVDGGIGWANIGIAANRAIEVRKVIKAKEAEVASAPELPLE